MHSIDAPLFWDEPEANMNPKLMQLASTNVAGFISQWETDYTC